MRSCWKPWLLVCFLAIGTNCQEEGDELDHDDAAHGDVDDMELPEGDSEDYNEQIGEEFHDVAGDEDTGDDDSDDTEGFQLQEQEDADNSEDTVDEDGKTGSEAADEASADSDEEGYLEQEELFSAEQAKGMHATIDTNGDGKLSMAEILEFSKKTRKSIAKQDVSVLLEELDSNKDGKISLEEHMNSSFPSVEFLEGDEDPEQLSDQEKAEKEAGTKASKELERRKFKAADHDGDDYLDMDELPAAFYPDTHDGVLALTTDASLKAKDKDGDGHLSLDEFWESGGGDEEDETANQQQKADFEQLDADKNGKLSLAEVQHWESGLFHTAAAMTHLFELADEDNDSHISLQELDNSRLPLMGSEAGSYFGEWIEHHEL